MLENTFGFLFLEMSVQNVLLNSWSSFSCSKLVFFRKIVLVFLGSLIIGFNVFELHSYVMIFDA